MKKTLLVLTLMSLSSCSINGGAELPRVPMPIKPTLRAVNFAAKNGLACTTPEDFHSLINNQRKLEVYAEELENLLKPYQSMPD